MTGITCVYTTNRQEPKFDWFLHSLKNQLRPNVQLQVIVIDCIADKRVKFTEHMQSILPNCEVLHIAPLPSYCQGQHRLTKEDYFSAVIARNTAFVYAIHPYVVFADDLSVLMPNWLNSVVESANGGYVVQGSYEKRNGMVVDNGVLTESVAIQGGVDSRRGYVKNNPTMTGRPEWSYGCSLGVPLELALKVNGYDELCSITGYEDSQFGVRLAKAGASFIYDTRMLTIESAEHHFTEGNYYKRIDPETAYENYRNVLGRFGCDRSSYTHASRWDASHVIVDLPKLKSDYRSYWNNYDIRALRRKREAGEKITVEDMNFPNKWWWDNMPLSEM